MGFDPVPWMIDRDFKLNSFLLMVIVIWMFTGFAMVSLSAAIKGVPAETIEAARVDGASEGHIFRHIVLPQIRSTIAVMLVTIALLTLKIFDVVYSMTGGRFGTDVVGNLFYTLLFGMRDVSLAAVLVVILLILVIPIMAINIRRVARAGRQA
jgi:alpha-glucoside transport system permease protein